MKGAQTQRSIGLYGGSFNPPHIAHVLVAGWALATGFVDAVWVIPTGGHPFGKQLAPFEDRMEMCRRAFGCYGARAEVLDIEGDDRTHYTIDTLTTLTEQHPDCRWRWLMGSDTLELAHKWKRFEDVRALAPPLIVPRAGHEAQSSAPTENLHDPIRVFALPDVSSSIIRERIEAGELEKLSGLLPGGVMEWIRHRKLYSVCPPA